MPTPPSTLTNTPYQNRIQLLLGSGYVGPLQSNALGAFNPARDLEVYVDGDIQKIASASFDPIYNRYLIFTAAPFVPGASVVQVVYHMPQNAFFDQNYNYFPGFAQVTPNTTQGDPAVPTVTVAVRPPLVHTAQVALYWNAVNVPQITVTSSTGFGSGLVSAAAVAGVFYAPAAAAGNYTATITGFDANGNVIIIGGNQLSQTIPFSIT
jgi:hypothetical protein